jgi:hypothetical protein
VDAAYLGISGRAVRAATAARQVAEATGAGQDVIQACIALIEELEKSHKLLTGVAGGFRRTGADPATFPGLFDAFRYEFKEYYDNQSWQSERTHCHEVNLRAQPARALLANVLSAEDAKQLSQDLDRLGSADDDIVIYLAGFLETMNREVDAITQCLRSGDVAGAVARKLAFEDQISPTFRRS